MGLTGAGKSTVAQAVAAATGWPVLDEELVLERSAGDTAEGLLARGGEAALRAAESDVLTLTLSLPPPLVAGVASGVVLDARDRDRLTAGGHVVWLRASVPTLVRRLAKRPGRTRTDEETAALLRTLAAEREPLYAAVAHQVLDTDVLPAVRAARQVLAAVEA